MIHITAAPREGTKAPTIREMLRAAIDHCQRIDEYLKRDSTYAAFEYASVASDRCFKGREISLDEPTVQFHFVVENVEVTVQANSNLEALQTRLEHATRLEQSLGPLTGSRRQQIGP